MTGVLDSRPVCEELPDAIDGTQTPAPPPAPAPGSWLALGLEPFPGSNPKLLRETLWDREQVRTFRARMKDSGGSSSTRTKIRSVDYERLLLAMTAPIQLRFRAAQGEARPPAESQADPGTSGS